MDEREPFPKRRSRLAMLVELIRQARLIWRLLLDPRVSLLAKAVVPLALLYIIHPLDLAPDVLPGLGQVDDLAILLLGAWLFLELCPKEVVKEHQEKLSAAKYHVHKEEASEPSGSARRELEANYRIVGQERIADTPQANRNE